MGFAILWVMLFHAKLQLNHLVKDFIFDIGYGGVDIFLFLSGFGLYYSCSNNWNGNKNYFIKRFKRILPAFWTVIIFMFIIQGPYCLKGLLVVCAKCTTLGLWIPAIPMYLWYISLISLLYAIYPSFYRFYTTKTIVATFVILVISFALMLIYIVNNINSEKNSLQILAISRLPIFFIGSFWGKYLENERKCKGRLFLIIQMLFGFLCLFFFRNNLQPYLWNGALAFIPFILIVPGLCYTISAILELCPLIAKPFNFLGKYTLEIYILNEFLLAYCFPFLIARIPSENICKVIILIINIIFAIMLYKVIHYITLLLKK